MSKTNKKMQNSKKMISDKKIEAFFRFTNFHTHTTNLYLFSLIIFHSYGKYKVTGSIERKNLYI